MVKARLIPFFVDSLFGFLILVLALEVALAKTGNSPNDQFTFKSEDHIRLQSIPSDDFTSLIHPQFPGHRVRIKKSNFCDPTVNVYTGYLDVNAGAKHLFFYFFESRRDPQNDDVLMWINGGPGCSSSLGLLMELGPCSIDMRKNASTGSNGTTWNPYGWNEAANVFFLDQPVGVGFSYADYGENIQTTEDAAKDVHAFISIFFETFKEFSGRALHLSGESYGGRYLPVFASEIYDQNQIAVKEGRAENVINLQSMIIGNGNTGVEYLYPGKYEIECGVAALEVPFQLINKCVRMKRALPRCQHALKAGCFDQFDLMNCRAAIDFCDNELSKPLRDSGRNPYDVSKMCVGSDLCYAENEMIAKYLDLPQTRELLGVSPHSPSNFSACSDAVGNGFDAHMDKYAIPTQYHVAALLDRGVRVLIYAGTYDWQCNWVSNKAWTDALEWGGAGTYVKEEMRVWAVDPDREAGEVKGNGFDAQNGKGGLAFVTIKGAGHMMSLFFSFFFLAA
ncbi:hypothetical protein E1B28_004774 [Marasmius oreades]|uniref:Carboxypeptidase n=1 Tax=Marasmius oreades TaxID=181124 RepID=A0A9P7UZI3_9AGAR|nr:uncharacterized protein E1B28_004774 [Marasmius oreades]KAG7097430.1 hypothetical protein E1B28_004774 [Marasmius oreades]